MSLDIRYAESGEVNVAYHLVGDGPIDLVISMGAREPRGDVGSAGIPTTLRAPWIVLGNDEYRAWLGRLQVQSASPTDAIVFMRMAFDIDVRHIVPAVKVPTLIIHRVGDRVCHVENARFLARHIEGAKYVELPGRTTRSGAVAPRSATRFRSS